MSELIARIDSELAKNTNLSCGYAAYARLIDDYDREYSRSPSTAAVRLTVRMLAIATNAYRAAFAVSPQLFRFSDGANMCLFDVTNGRTIMMWGITRDIAPNTRDNAYHAGFPRAGDGYDKGHALSHAQGGLEGGPNYIKQKATVNRRLSDVGHLWRDIETFLAANAGLLAFVRMIYAKGDAGDRPINVEYTILAGRSQFRSVIFPN